MSITRWMGTIVCAFFLVLCMPFGVAFADEGSDLATGASPELTDPSVTVPGEEPGVDTGSDATEPEAEPEPEPAIVEPAKKVRISEGAYLLSSKLSSDLKLDLVGKAAKSGVQAAVKKRGKSTARQFYIRPEGKNRYSIQVMSTGLFVTESNGKALLRPWSGKDQQLWWAASNSGATFVNVSSGKALAVAGGKAKSGAKLVAAPFTKAKAKAKAQRWKLASRKIISNGYYRLRSSVGTYLNLAGGGYKDGSNVNAAKKTKTGSQCFEVKAVGSSYRIENARSFKSISVNKGSKKNGANIVQRASTKSKSRLWKAAIDRKGRLVFVNAKTGKALSVKANSRKSGANVIQRKLDGTRGQAWKLVATTRYSVSGDSELDRGIADVLSGGDSLRNAFDFVRDKCSWADPDTAYRSGRYMSDYNTKRYAKEMISRRSGSCYCSSSLFMWLARALGYGANVTVGYLQSNTPGLVGAHSWVEVYENGKTYVCDPDCERGYRYRDWFMKSYATTPAEYHFF